MRLPHFDPEGGTVLAVFVALTALYVGVIISVVGVVLWAIVTLVHHFAK